MPIKKQDLANHNKQAKKPSFNIYNSKLTRKALSTYVQNNAIQVLNPEFAELDEYIDQPVRTYSSGMRARLGFAVSINIKPEILIVDEALSVGDKEFRKKCRQKVNEIIEKNNVTLVFVTHSISMAKEFCKRGIVMKKGKLVYDSDINDAIKFYDPPKTAKK